MSERAVGEAAAVAAVGAALGGAVGVAAGAALPVAVVGGLNGLISGWRGVYDWRSRVGVTALVLDSTWALGTTAAGLVAHAAAALRGQPGYSEAMSRRQNRHVYARGLQPRRGFAMTLGNVVNGAGDLSNPRRVKLVTDHENVHVWQARWFGPTYPMLYLGWMAGGAMAGAVLWATKRRDESFARVVESCAYYLNPFEYWAYSRDDHWPPKGMLPMLGPRKPIVQGFVKLR